MCSTEKYIGKKLLADDELAELYDFFNLPDDDVIVIKSRDAFEAYIKLLLHCDNITGIENHNDHLENNDNTHVENFDMVM